MVSSYKFPFVLRLPVRTVEALKKAGIELRKCPPQPIIELGVTEVVPMKKPIGLIYQMRMLYPYTKKGIQ